MMTSLLFPILRLLSGQARPTRSNETGNRTRSRSAATRGARARKTGRTRDSTAEGALELRDEEVSEVDRADGAVAVHVHALGPRSRISALERRDEEVPEVGGAHRKVLVEIGIARVAVAVRVVIARRRRRRVARVQRALVEHIRNTVAVRVGREPCERSD